MTSVTVLVPVLNRPHRVAPLIESLDHSVALEDAQVELLFLASPGDDDELDELEPEQCTLLLRYHKAFRTARNEMAKLNGPEIVAFTIPTDET